MRHAEANAVAPLMIPVSRLAGDDGHHPAARLQQKRRNAAYMQRA